ncbi:MotA/TolQ/ExbB proton channel family protein [Pseudodesulfovibrio sediminis]|uniref:MotA/TolQ/ExbB proton channel domain-containing protein n=1 Tax=Pseudodesulfovibrio sediminis TaxID=2810563 RepID=A0ABN6ESB3_9BACT|nr:MotA/TolQ/ExbB proton channel family protein [Pseudodesulfovibrio sediminis]BCS88144.1 hypothetical protein PSDVSF_13860 [Pseudodesulfovibrio sediminis]
MFDQLSKQLMQGGSIMLPIGFLALALWWLVFLKAWEIWVLNHAENKSDMLHVHETQGWQNALSKEYLTSRSGNEELDVELARVLVDRHAGYVEKGITTIMVLAATAPLLGLLGTVSGMVDTFDVIAQFGTGNAKGLASGISQALVTTQSGLIVAVPGMMAGGFLYRKANKLRRRMELFLSRMERMITNKEAQA